MIYIVGELYHDQAFMFHTSSNPHTPPPPRLPPLVFKALPPRHAAVSVRELFAQVADPRS